MAEFYNSIGTIICYSESEGTPNPVLEAAMCGRPVISTNVGNVPELMSKIDRFEPVTSYRSLLSMVKKYGSGIDLNNIGSEIGNAASKEWAWESKAQNFIGLLR